MLKTARKSENQSLALKADRGIPQSHFTQNFVRMAEEIARPPRIPYALPFGVAF